MPPTAAISRLVAAMSEQQVRSLLTDLLLETPQPAPAVRTRRRRKANGDGLNAKQRYIARRSARRAAVRAEQKPAPAPATKAKPFKLRKGGRPRKAVVATPKPASTAGNGAADSAAWLASARATHSIADRLPEHASRE